MECPIIFAQLLDMKWHCLLYASKALSRDSTESTNPKNRHFWVLISIYWRDSRILRIPQVQRVGINRKDL